MMLVLQRVASALMASIRSFASLLTSLSSRDRTLMKAVRVSGWRVRPRALKACRILRRFILFGLCSVSFEGLLRARLNVGCVYIAILA